MARRQYTTAEAFRMVASGEREEMVADGDSSTNNEKISADGEFVRFWYQVDSNNQWVQTHEIALRDDYHDPNEAEDPSEPQWRPCDKAFALAHPNESEGQCKRLLETWEQFEARVDRKWVPVSEYRFPDHEAFEHEYRFRTTAPDGKLPGTPDRMIAKEEPQWRPCSKAFALRNPEQSEARVISTGPNHGVEWHPLACFSPPITCDTHEFRTHAPVPAGYLCEIPAGVTGIEVVTTTDRGRVNTSGTVRAGGKAGRVVFVEDES